MPGSNKMLKKAMSCICFIYRLMQKSVIGSPHPKFIGHNEAMTGKVSVSQVPNSPEGEKQGWPVKVVRAGVGGNGLKVIPVYKLSMKRPQPYLFQPIFKLLFFYVLYPCY